eukprot:s2440_g8.t1
MSSCRQRAEGSLLGIPDGKERADWRGVTYNSQSQQLPPCTGAWPGAMLRITLLSGEEVASLPLKELSDVKALKQRLHEQHRLPPRFRQRLLHEGKTLDDAVALDSAMDLQMLIIEAWEDQRPELCEAARAGLVTEVEALLQLPMAPDAADDEFCMTSLMHASENGHVDVVQLLLEAGAEKDLRDIDGRTALMAAAYDGHAQVVQLLLEAGAQKDLSDNLGNTALILAACSDHAPVVQLLLQARAQTDLVNADGNTAVVDAALNGHARVVQLFLEADAQNDLCDGLTLAELLEATKVPRAPCRESQDSAPGICFARPMVEHP